jgi:hypothetical protein
MRFAIVTETTWETRIEDLSVGVFPSIGMVRILVDLGNFSPSYNTLFDAAEPMERQMRVRSFPGKI